jgi:hypothetical protein
MGSICHCIDLYQHLSLKVFVGCQVGGTSAAADGLDVFIEFSETATESGVKLVLDCVVLSA